MPSSPFDFVITGDVVLADSVLTDGYVAIAGDRIAAVGEGPAPDAKQAKRYQDCLIFPGIVDGQIHAGSVEGVPGLRDATRAAAAGGVTTVVDMPFDDPNPVDTVARLESKIAELEDIAVVDVALYATAPKGAAHYGIADLAAAGAAAIKLSTFEYHPVRFPRFSTAEMYEIFEEAAAANLPVGFHNEDQELVTHLVDRWVAKDDRAPAAHGATRPPIAELVADAQILELASHTDVQCHIVHSSLAAGNRIAMHYRSLGNKVSVETCIHYLVFDEEEMIRQGGFLKLNPPIRTAAERDGLWDSMLSGEVDFVSTDHVAWPEDRKSNPDIFKNSSGIPGLETFLPGFYTAAVDQRGLSPCVVARLAAENPARHFRLFPRKGRIAAGADADIAVLARQRKAYDARTMTSETKWSPFDGMTMAGNVIATYVRGQPVYEDGRILAEDGYGHFVRPNG